MTLQEVETSEKDVLTIDDVKDILHCHPQTLRLQARSKPELLGFPVVVMGGMVKIPRLGFLHYLKYGRSTPAQKRD